MKIIENTESFDMLTKEEIKKIEKTIGYTFRDVTLLNQAFTRSSYTSENFESRDNEVLQFFGDAILSYVVCTILLDRCTGRDNDGLFSYMQESDFINMRDSRTNHAYLAKKMKALQLSQYLISGSGEEKDEFAESEEALANLAESLISAVYIDSDRDIETVRMIGCYLFGL
ncbi:MAG: hypothetical protein IJV98_07570 [Clostridia bacterium]|nr:hypothetical protein [Clostridia bacterium]